MWIRPPALHSPGRKPGVHSRRKRGSSKNTRRRTAWSARESPCVPPPPCLRWTVACYPASRLAWWTTAPPAVSAALAAPRSASPPRVPAHDAPWLSGGSVRRVGRQFRPRTFIPRRWHRDGERHDNSDRRMNPDEQGGRAVRYLRGVGLCLLRARATAGGGGTMRRRTVLGRAERHG